MAVILMLVNAGRVHHLYLQDDDFRNVSAVTYFYLFLMFGPPGIVFGLLALLIRRSNVCKRAEDLENVIM
ncbi:hypothetical protein RvY_14085 [Ramazzottius varieornatus]|uniref:Uncharacterized protein n=1 Tax=Ramazzottius varieornatus TaxID=947166 RepID=A0A1D1VXE9_RAMVA|nr:hypothetical protein RvY_14085 [Ramazzottius varieornatus]